MRAVESTEETVVVDVAIVGYGGAGASAAIEAHDAACSVIVIEKESAGGGSTRESGGTIRTLLDRAGAVGHYEALTMGNTPRVMLEVYAEGLDQLPRWLEDLGAVLVDSPKLGGFPVTHRQSAFPNLPGANALGTRLRVIAEQPNDNGGLSLWNVLNRAVRTRGIRVELDVPAQRLLREPTGEISGVRAVRKDGSALVVRARKGVILASGGFAYNKQMHMDYFGVTLEAFGPPNRNTGDGIRLAQDVGADLWHMNAIAGPFGYKFPEYEAAFGHRMPTAGYLYLDRRGRRFTNETALEHHSCALASMAYDPAELRYTRMPSYVVFDERTRLSGPVRGGNNGYNREVPWSADNSAEIARGWITAAGSVAELAAKLGLPVEAATAEIDRFNGFCKQGVDEDFARSAEHLVPLTEPPFYALELWPSLLNTQGGPRRNERAEVLGMFGEPISRLYSAGELGSMWGMLYPGAGNVSEALVYGRIAGRNVSAHKPLDL